MIDTKITTKDSLIRQVAKQSGLDIKTVRRVHETLEDKIRNLLSEANLKQDVIVKLFEGISIDSKFVPEKEKINNLTGEKIVAVSKIKPKANITRSYCEKLTYQNEH